MSPRFQAAARAALGAVLMGRCLAAGVAWADDDLKPVQIVVVAPATLQEQLHDAVMSLLPQPDRVVWIDPAFAPAGLDRGGHIQVRVEIPPGAETRISAYRPEGAPIVRMVEGGQPERVTIEIVAQIVSEMVRRLLGAETPTASPRPPVTAPEATAVATVPAAAPASSLARAWAARSLCFGVGYLKRAVGNPDAWFATSETGVSGQATVSIFDGRFPMLGSIAADLTNGQAYDYEGLTHFRRASAYGLVGVGWRPGRWFQIGASAGGGVERVWYPDYPNDTAWGPIGRAALEVALAVPNPSDEPGWGLLVTAAATIDLRPPLEVYQTPFRKEPAQLGFVLGLAWRSAE